MYIFILIFFQKRQESKNLSEKFQKSEAEMCLAMCLKKQEFQADCVYKLGVYKKKCVYTALFISITLIGKLLEQRFLFL